MKRVYYNTLALYDDPPSAFSPAALLNVLERRASGPRLSLHFNGKHKGFSIIDVALGVAADAWIVDLKLNVSAQRDDGSARIRKNNQHLCLSAGRFAPSVYDRITGACLKHSTTRGTCYGREPSTTHGVLGSTLKAQYDTGTPYFSTALELVRE